MNPKIEKQIQELNSKLRTEGLGPHTRRVYIWHAKDFLKEIQEKSVRANDMNQAAVNYLRRQRTKSRSHFLQSCRALSVLMGKVLKKPIPSAQIEKLQSVK